MSIAGKAVRGAAWNMVAGVGSRIVALAGTLILTRFIAPDEYGEISAASITVLTAMMLTHASVGQSIIARRDGADACYHAFLIHMATGALALIPVLALGPSFANLLDAPRMTRFIPGFVVVALLERTSYVPGRVLVRDLRFKTVALTRGIGELAFVAVSLALAPRYQGYAIVAGNLARAGFILAAYLIRLDRREWFVPQPLRWETARGLLSFGLPLSAASLLEFASVRWDNLLVSHYFGPPVLGAYNLSYNLADTPTINVAEHIGDVLLPSFTKMELKQRKNALVRAAAIMGLLVFPLSVGLAAIAPTLVQTVFDRRWLDIAPMLMILSILSVVRPMTWTLVAFLQAQHRSRTLMLLNAYKLGVLIGLIVTVGRLGPRWTCVCVGVAFASFAAAMLWTVQKIDGVPARRFIAGALPSLVCCAPMFAAVTGVRLLLRSWGLGATWISLGVEMIAGAAVYIAATLVIARPIVLDVINLLRNAVRTRDS